MKTSSTVMLQNTFKSYKPCSEAGGQHFKIPLWSMVHWTARNNGFWTQASHALMFPWYLPCHTSCTKIPTILLILLLFTVLVIKNYNTYFMPLSVSNVGSNWRILFSKKSLIIAGSRSGSSPISLENHLKQASLSEGKTASSARHCQICFAWSAHNHSWPSYKRNCCHEAEQSTWLSDTFHS